MNAEFADDSNYREKSSPLRGRRGDATLRELLTEIELWRGSDGRGYGTIEIDRHREHWHILSKGFANWLRLRTQLRGEPMLGSAEVERLTANLNARCLGLGELHEVSHRIA